MLLINDDVVLRAIELTDAEFLREMVNDPKLESMVPGWSLPVSMKRQQEWINALEPNDMKFVIEVKDTAIGMASITGLDFKNSVANLNIKIKSESNRGKGIGYKTVSLLVTYCFEELNLNCLIANILEHNLASQRLFERCGFCRDGVLRSRVYKKGRYHNLLTYSLLRSEYNA